jgi:hypothetical protein
VIHGYQIVPAPNYHDRGNSIVIADKAGTSRGTELALAEIAVGIVGPVTATAVGAAVIAEITSTASMPVRQI